MHLAQSGLIKIGALISYCGGPLILSDLLKPRLGAPLAFGVTFAPIALWLFGSMALAESAWEGPRAGSANRELPAPGELAAPMEPSGTVPDLVGWGDEARHGILMLRLGVVGAVLTLIMHLYGAWTLATTTARADSGLNLVGLVVGAPMAGGFLYLARKRLSRVGAFHVGTSPIDPT